MLLEKLLRDERPSGNGQLSLHLDEYEQRKKKNIELGVFKAFWSFPIHCTLLLLNMAAFVAMCEYFDIKRCNSGVKSWTFEDLSTQFV